jgi:hypothetical protein
MIELEMSDTANDLDPQNHVQVHDCDHDLALVPKMQHTEIHVSDHVLHMMQNTENLLNLIRVRNSEILAENQRIEGPHPQDHQKRERGTPNSEDSPPPPPKRVESFHNEPMDVDLDETAAISAFSNSGLENQKFVIGDPKEHESHGKQHDMDVRAVSSSCPLINPGSFSPERPPIGISHGSDRETPPGWSQGGGSSSQLEVPPLTLGLPISPPRGGDLHLWFKVNFQWVSPL